jgi:Altered inheritance of mitochondria protein 21
MSYPDEQIGYMASEQYSGTPNYLTKMQSNSSQPHVESPLRKASFPTDDSGRDDFKGSKKSSSLHSRDGDDAIEEDDSVHIVPGRHYKVTGGEETMHETEEARPYLHERASQSFLADEHDYNVPILAEDEVARGGSEFMQPAISPKQDRRGSSYDLEYRSGDHTPSSRPVSRPSSVYGLQGVNHTLSRFSTHHDERDSMHTPLEDVAEYEPLFPEDDGSKRPVSHAERFKQRPEMWRHRFPSQDIWEDTPDSSMYVTTVSTPDVPQKKEDAKPETGFEHPDVEATRKGEPSEAEKRKLVPTEERLAKSMFAPHLRDDMPARPSIQPRFPSQDIWEDSPDSQHLVTTVSGPQMEEDTSPVETRPSIPPRPVGKSRLSEGATSAQVAPSVPARPTKYSTSPPDAKMSDPSTSPTDRKAPVVPERPKPQVPARPAKKLSGDSLSKTLSATSTGSVETVKSPPLTKVKPVVPARPGSKIQSLKGNFMNDLNQKLGLGQPKEKEPEPEIEKEAKPLEDARKGRARGPQRRAPAKSPSSVETPTTKAPMLAMFAPQSHWNIDPEDGLLSQGAQQVKTEPESLEEMPKPDLSTEKLEQIDHATIADAPTVDTTPEAPRATALSTNDAAESIDHESGPPAPSRELSDPMQKAIANSTDNDGGDLSQKTTKSSEYSGRTLTREEVDPNTDAIPLSRNTTRRTDASGDTLEKVETHYPTEKKAEEEPIVKRDGQVSAPAPVPEVQQDNDGDLSQSLTEEDVGAKEPKEPMAEDDVSYKRLEEMTAQADGKGHAEEEKSCE